MVDCDICGKSVRNTQALGGHYRFSHGIERVSGNTSSAGGSTPFVTAAQVEDVVAEQLGGLLDSLVDRVSGPARDLVRREIDEAFKARDAEIAGLRRRVDELESGKSELAAFAHFVKDDVLPATQRQLDSKQDAEPIIRIVGDKASMPLRWEPASECGHDAPPGTQTCDSLLCVAGRLDIQGRGR